MNALFIAVKLMYLGHVEIMYMSMWTSLCYHNAYMRTCYMKYKLYGEAMMCVDLVLIMQQRVWEV